MLGSLSGWVWGEVSSQNESGILGAVISGSQHSTTSQFGVAVNGLECFQLGRAGLHSLDFTFNRFRMKLLKLGALM